MWLLYFRSENERLEMLFRVCAGAEGAAADDDDDVFVAHPEKMSLSM